MAEGAAAHVVGQRVQDVEQQVAAQLADVRQPRHLQEIKQRLSSVAQT